MQGRVGEFVDLRLPVRNDLATIRMRQSSKKPGHAWIWCDGSVTGIVIDRSIRRPLAWVFQVHSEPTKSAHR
jgi:hypothetical protein